MDFKEFKEASTGLLKAIQRRHFLSEIRLEGHNLPKTSKLYQYQPFVDKQGLLRCRSKLERSTDLSHDEKFPIILPNNDRLLSC